MPRVKRGTLHVKRRKGILKHTKGFQAGRKNLIKLAQTAETKAGAHAYRDRKNKKRLARQLWNVKINAAVRPFDMSYSKFMNALKNNAIKLDRKVLSQVAEFYPQAFEKIVQEIK